MIDEINSISSIVGGGPVQTFRASTGRVAGFDIDIVKPQIRKPQILKYKIFRVVTEATGDGIYNCYEMKLDSTDWDDTAGTIKFNLKNMTSIEVLNLAEFNPEATYVAHLVANDVLIAWPILDDEDNARWMGIPFRSGVHGSNTRRAFCKNDAGSGATIDCYLDTDGSGTEITVNCDIAQGGTALNAAVPRLKDGDAISVYKIGSGWYCATTFMPSVDCDCYQA